MFFEVGKGDYERFTQIMRLGLPPPQRFDKSDGEAEHSHVDTKHHTVADPGGGGLGGLNPPFRGWFFFLLVSI